MKKKILLSIPVSCIVLSALLIPAKAEAKGFGTETEVEIIDSGAGFCTKHTTTKLKVFWITVQKVTESTFGPCDSI